ALVLYDVAGEPVNTLRDGFQDEFEATFGRLAEDSAVKAIVLASAKPDSFVAGADIEMLSRLSSAAEASGLARGGQRAMQRDEVVPKAILLEVARRRARELAAGELRVERRKVELKLPKLLRTEVLQQIALEDNPVGRRILVQHARKALLEKTRGHYPAPERALEAIRIGTEKGPEEGYRAEANVFGELVVSDVSRRLVEIFFATQALKKDTGVDDPSVKPRTVEKVAMLGAGLMGAGIAYVTADAGIPVRLKDKDDAA